MKAVLQSENVRFGKVHSLEYLLGMVKGFMPQLVLFERELAKIDKFAVETRYPGEGADKKDAEMSVDIVKRARKIIRGYLGLKSKK